MKRLRILPGAAGVIALTAAIGFVDGQPKIETESFSGDRIKLVGPQTAVSAVGATSGNSLIIKPDNAAYLVEIRHGDNSAGILVDAVTGKVLLS